MSSRYEVQSSTITILNYAVNNLKRQFQFCYHILITTTICITTRCTKNLTSSKRYLTCCEQLGQIILTEEWGSVARFPVGALVIAIFPLSCKTTIVKTEQKLSAFATEAVLGSQIFYGFIKLIIKASVSCDSDEQNLFLNYKNIALITK